MNDIDIIKDIIKYGSLDNKKYCEERKQLLNLRNKEAKEKAQAQYDKVVEFIESKKNTMMDESNADKCTTMFDCGYLLGLYTMFHKYRINDIDKTTNRCIKSLYNNSNITAGEERWQTYRFMFEECLPVEIQNIIRDMRRRKQMKLIIDIPEEDYEYIKNSNDMNFNAIKNGILLEDIVDGIESHKWGHNEGSKEIYNNAIDDVLTYIEEQLGE